MNTEIQAKYNIKATDHVFFEGENSPTITVETEIDVFYVQTVNGNYSLSKGCWILAVDDQGDINFDDYQKKYQDNISAVMKVVIEVANAEAKTVIKECTIKRILKEDKSGKLQTKAEKITHIVGNGVTEDYLILAQSLQKAESIYICYAMINLQITLNCSQQQNNDIIDLFI